MRTTDKRMQSEPATALGGAERAYHYVACYYRTDAGERYSAIGHGWIIRGPNYVGCQGWRTLTEAVTDCATWDDTGVVVSHRAVSPEEQEYNRDLALRARNGQVGSGMRSPD